MTYFTKRYHPPGTPPGTLIAETGVDQIRIKLLDYTPDEFVELELSDPDDCRPYLERKSITWVHVGGIARAETVRELGNLFGLHPLALEDVVNTGQRPKADSYGEQLFVVMNLPTVTDDNQVQTEQVSLFLGSNFLISFHRGESEPFEPVMQRLRKHSGKIRERSVDYLLYALLDVTIDRGFPVLEYLSEYIEDLEEELLEDPGKQTLAKIHRVKRELLLLRRMLWPQREVINLLVRDEQPHIQNETRPYLSDCYDHTIQIIDLIEVYREMTASMLDVYLSSVSNRLNEVMRVLTVIATIFIPLTFIVGVYGMNFSNKSTSPWAMPELNWYYGYPILWLVMLAIAGGMMFYFKRRKWF
jgi:magnesium transporter